MFRPLVAIIRTIHSSPPHDWISRFSSFLSFLSFCVLLFLLLLLPGFCFLLYVLSWSSFLGTCFSSLFLRLFDITEACLYVL